MYSRNKGQYRDYEFNQSPIEYAPAGSSYI